MGRTFRVYSGTEVLVRSTVGWWPNRPRATAPGPLLPLQHVFPSGRAAIAQSLQALELPLTSAIGIAGYSSECLRRIVGRCGTPVDVADGVTGVRAAVVYEPWGWPLTADAWAELRARFGGGGLVIDRVDSADFFANDHAEGLPQGSVEVLSLAKLLGLDGGGLARSNGALIAFEPEPQSDGMRRLRNRPVGVLARGGYREFFKETRQAVHPAALAWLARNCLETAAERERMARQQHLRALLDSGLSAGWPVWMKQAYGRGAGPVWAPVCRGQDAAQRWRAAQLLDRRFGVVSTSRLFNWSGNPLRPKYEMCLAVPMHSGVTDFGEVIAALT